jgi:hypothetical protein
VDGQDVARCTKSVRWPRGLVAQALAGELQQRRPAGDLFAISLADGIVAAEGERGDGCFATVWVGFHDSEQRQAPTRLPLLVSISS